MGRRCPARAQAFGAVIAAAMVVTIAGCSSSGIATEKPTGASASASPTVSAAILSPRAAVLAQYGGFWRELTPASGAPASERRALLARYATDPELTSLLRGMATADRKGQVFYGRNVPRAKLIRLSTTQGVAVVDDCQDSSHAGIATKATGHPVTVGVRRNHVIATLHRDSDGAWLIAFVSYSRTKC